MEVRNEKKKAMKPQNSDLPVHIVEQHNDVVPFIHRAIASKKLPFSGIPIIHLDSHPDLLIPIHLDADTIFKPPELYDALSIENWLLPLTFAKHIDHVVWVKPPWASQIKASEQSFTIGKCCHSGKLRLSCKENYFLTDGLFCTPSDLQDSVECKLTVAELRPNNWGDLSSCAEPTISSKQKSAEEDKSSKPEISSSGDSTFGAKNIAREPSSVNQKASLNHLSSPVSSISTSTNKKTVEKSNEISAAPDKSEHNVFSHYVEWTNHLLDIVTTKPYILDIDLDFFSTKDPFMGLFDAEREVLQRIFKCPPLLGTTDEEVETYTCLRQKQLEELELLFISLNEKWCEEQSSSVSLTDVSSMSLADLTGLGENDLEYFQAEEQKDLLALCHKVLPDMQERGVTFLQLYDFGCTLDETDLPHHVSTNAQIEALGSCLRSVVEKLPKPTVVTISRSSHDEYCPLHQVDGIELMVLKILTDVHGKLHVTKNFDD